MQPSPIKNENLLKMLRRTQRWRPAVAKTAALFADVHIAEYENMIRFLVESGEDKALGILMCVCGANDVLLNPHVLAEALKVAEPVIDFSFPFRVQGSDAIEPLLTAVQAEDISWERQALGATIAAELAVRGDSHRLIVKNVLLKLTQKIHAFEANLLIDHSLALLDGENASQSNVPWVTKQEVLESLPQEKPPVVIGGDYTVRRPVPKIGRNAPCPCGSGKKYKKCCYEKDQRLLRDASPYEGITMTQLRAMPKLANDAEIVKKMRAYELKKLEPVKLNEEQLYQAYRRAVHFGLRQLAYDLLLELKGRPDRQDFALDHMEDLLESALDAGDIEVARKTMDLIPPEKLHDAETVKFQFDLLQNREHYASLEARSRQALKEEEDEDLINWDYGLLALSYKFENILPALSIVFARAAVMGRQDAYFDNEMLVETIRSCRAELGHDPWEDPLEDFFDWTMKKSDFNFQDEAKDRQIRKLKEKVIQANRTATKKHSELKAKELELNRLGKKLEGTAKATAALRNMAGTAAPLSPEERKSAADLHRQIDNLKAEINIQQHDRRQLRRQLQEAQKKLRIREVPKAPAAPSDEQTGGLEPEAAIKKILIPEFTPPFRRSCESLPAPVVAKALRAATDFASHDKSLWRRTKPIETLSRVFRIQIGRQHRLLVGWEPEARLDILDLIHRSQLETWIKRYAG
jgi:hypothetical protein